MTEQEQIEADIEDAIHNHLGSHVEYVEFDADTTDGDTVLTEVRISDIAARLGPALHAAGYRLIPDEPTEEMENAVRVELKRCGITAVGGDRHDIAAAVLDVLRGAS